MSLPNSWLSTFSAFFDHSECCHQQEGELNKLPKQTANYHSSLGDTYFHVKHVRNVSVIHSYSQCEFCINTAQVIHT